MRKTRTVLACVMMASVIGLLCPAGVAAEVEKNVRQEWKTKPGANSFDKPRHEEIMAHPNRAECPLVFVGDSITFGWTAEGGGKAVWDKEYAPMKAMNLGVVCDTTGNVLWRLDQGDLDGMNRLEVVVLMIGTNDIGLGRRSAEDTVDGVKAVVAKLREKAPQAKILLMGISPKGRHQETVEATNKVICKLHDGKHVFYQDISPALDAWSCPACKVKGCLADRVGHLLPIGYEIWADEIRPTLAELMK